MTAHRVVVTWCAEPGADLLALLPHAAEPLRAGAEDDLRRQVDDVLTGLHGPGRYDVVYRRVSPNSFGA
jgi:hypothetical protein